VAAQLWEVGTTHLTADICAVYPGNIVDLFVKDQIPGATYFRYTVLFDAAAEVPGTWHWPEALPPGAEARLLVPSAVSRATAPPTPGPGTT